ncbi:MAG TPA: hypothetical protein VHB46_01740 [Burkholderiales bacterium]|nr:hypothetical protein [Burkholderiales bacterium]
MKQFLRELTCVFTLLLAVQVTEAADSNLTNFPIKLRNTYAKFIDDQGNAKIGPGGTRLLVVDDQGAKLVLQVQGDLPGNTIAENDRISPTGKYTVDAADFKSYWTNDPAGASQGSSANTANLTGSVLTLRADFPKLKDSSSGEFTRAPAKTKLRVRKDDGKELDMVVAGRPDIPFLPMLSGCEEGQIKSSAAEINKGELTCRSPGPNDAKEGPLYTVNKAEFGPEYWDRTGWAYGPLFVPFKMRFKDKSLTGEVGLGGYMGYEFQAYGVSLIPAVHAGLSIVTVGGDSSEANNVNDTTNKPAFTWGGGLIFKPGENFQAGVILGRDQIGGSVGRDWKYEGKWWISIAIGYNFAR